MFKQQLNGESSKMNVIIPICGSRADLINTGLLSVPTIFVSCGSVTEVTVKLIEFNFNLQSVNYCFHFLKWQSRCLETSVAVLCTIFRRGRPGLT